jgi:hypothetical protein
MSAPLRSEFTQQEVLQDIQDLYNIKLQLQDALDKRYFAERQMQEAENEVIKLATLAREREDYIVKLTREVNFVKEDCGRKFDDVQREITRLKTVVKDRDLSIKGLEWELNGSRQRELMSRQKLEYFMSLSAQTNTQAMMFAGKSEYVESGAVGTHEVQEEGFHKSQVTESSSALDKNTKLRMTRRHSSVITGRANGDEKSGDLDLSGMLKNMEVSFSSKIQGLQQQFFSTTVTTTSSQQLQSRLTDVQSP